uniref:Clan AA aspartic protease, AF_0612 family n=1 Tax=Candidatus Kentrum sp. LFY TaxID=2126342 RepID=A0A450WFE0_9GAMM|nr:MAG: hypothetical protein BECKLFY1418C_GA0070996_101734 [Candidatus Kentron sp. LFY]
MTPAEELERAGIRKEQKSVYELASGEKVEYERGFVRITLMGQETVSRVIFGPKGIEPILGALVLEGLGFVVDSTDKQLKKLPVRSLK